MQKETTTGEYLVVARRYRPQTFAELIGQSHVAKGLGAAIETSRVGHAYLFTGARGTGKTSTARILAKALNCERGPTQTPCNECDICTSVSSGDDMDVLEIDGASNRGIDEIRQLRQNVNVRPSRARFKIYIIDEVHMLTEPAFNALLKTLEEPPEHVKFIFCTTEPEKLPITIRSRCQRFDFAGIQPKEIVGRLQEIVATEGVTAEPEALVELARRAAGSMRDSQSLLEQLLAFGSQQITLADVHALLGTAGGARLSGLVKHLVEHDSGAALTDLDTALGEGVDVGQLLDQLLGYLRDCMAVAVGCPSDMLLHVAAGEQADVQAAAKQLGLETILAMMQILDHTISRLRYSTQTRILAELALVRICRLENLESLPQLIAQLRGGAAAPASRTASDGSSTSSSSAAAKKKGTDSLVSAASTAIKPADSNGSAAIVPSGASSSPLSEQTAAQVWEQALANMSDITAEFARMSTGVAITAPNQLAVVFPAKYNSGKLFCERPQQAAQLEQAVSRIAGQPIRLHFRLDPAETPAAETPQKRPATQRQRLNEKMQDPFVRKAVELFDAYDLRLLEERES